MEFKDRLRELREEKGLTQRELGQQIGFSMSIINKWENGKYIPAMPSVIKLAEFFGETTDYIMGLVD